MKPAPPVTRIFIASHLLDKPRGSAGRLLGSYHREHANPAFQKNLNIQPHRPILDVIEVQVDSTIERDSLPARHSPEARQSWLDCEDLFRSFSIAGKFKLAKHARPHKT